MAENFKNFNLNCNNCLERGTTDKYLIKIEVDVKCRKWRFTCGCGNVEVLE